MAAFFLARAGATVTVYEQASIGSGATGASMGVLIPYGYSRNHERAQQQRTSLDIWAQLGGQLGAQSSLLTYTKYPRLQLLYTPGQQAQATADAAASGGRQYIIPPAKLAEICPAAAASPYGALVCTATAQVHPRQVLGGLAQLCRQHGVTIHEQTPVTQLDDILADSRLLTMGAYTNHLWPAAQVRPYKGQAMMLAAPHVTLPYMLRNREGYILARDGCIWVGSTNEPESGFDNTPTAGGQAQLWQIATSLCPALAGAEVIEHWAGLRPFAPANSPLFQQLDARTWLAVGHGKIGLCLAPLVAQQVTAALMGTETSDLTT